MAAPVMMVENARNLLLAGDFDGSDFQSVKTACKKQINVLEKKLLDIARSAKMVDQILIVSMLSLKLLNYSYKRCGDALKRKIIVSNYPENMLFDGFEVRTP